jgi:hypothetical protein
MFRLLLVMACMMAVNVAAAPAVSATLVDTGTPDAGDYVLGLNTGPFGSRLAARFTLADNAIITGAEAHMFVYGGGVLNYDIVSAAGGLPDSGPVLFSSAVALDFLPYSWAGPSSLNWSLSAGDYWLILRPEEGSGFWAQLDYFTPNPLASYASYYTENPTWFAYSPHPVYGGDFGVRIFGTSGAVPEPASWGLMITGFGLTGVALRRRRALTA